MEIIIGLFVVITGNPFDGLNVYGPFYDIEAAGQWGETLSDSWWIVEVLPHNEP